MRVSPPGSPWAAKSGCPAGATGVSEADVAAAEVAAAAAAAAEVASGINPENARIEPASVVGHFNSPRPYEE
jgi:hypothetical protein